MRIFSVQDFVPQIKCEVCQMKENNAFSVNTAFSSGESG